MPEPTNPVRPERATFDPLPAIPVPDPTDDEHASTEYSNYRTGLSRHRTELSEHRTDLSEFRTDLSSSRTEMSMGRTGMSIQRTRMSADRTLMSIIRTSLSLIGFGFTVYQVFRKAAEAGTIASAQSALTFGLLLLLLGILLLVAGIVRHVQFALGLRRQRRAMIGDHLIEGDTEYPVSMTLVTAVLLLLIGLFAAATVVFDAGLPG